MIEISIAFFISVILLILSIIISTFTGKWIITKNFWDMDILTEHYVVIIFLNILNAVILLITLHLLEIIKLV